MKPPSFMGEPPQECAIIHCAIQTFEILGQTNQEEQIGDVHVKGVVMFLLNIATVH